MQKCHTADKVLLLILDLVLFAIGLALGAMGVHFHDCIVLPLRIFRHGVPTSLCSKLPLQNKTSLLSSSPLSSEADTGSDSSSFLLQVLFLFFLTTGTILHYHLWRLSHAPGCMVALQLIDNRVIGTYYVSQEEHKRGHCLYIASVKSGLIAGYIYVS